MTAPLITFFKRMTCKHSTVESSTTVYGGSSPYIETKTTCLDCGAGVPGKSPLSDVSKDYLLKYASTLPNGKVEVY